MDRERGIGLSGRRDIEKEREILCYPQCTDVLVRAISIDGNRQTLTVEQWTQRELGEQRQR